MRLDKVPRQQSMSQLPQNAHSVSKRVFIKESSIIMWSFAFFLSSLSGIRSWLSPTKYIIKNPSRGRVVSQNGNAVRRNLLSVNESNLKIEQEKLKFALGH